MKFFATLLFGAFIFYYADSRPFRVEQVPNGGKNQCLNCHTNGSGGSLNLFGQEILSNHLSSKNAAGNVIWSGALAKIDSDGDGFTNGQELLDPDGIWKIGDNDPGDPNNVGNPGNRNIVPVSVRDLFSVNSLANVIINSLSPNPVNEFINLQLEVKSDSKVVFQLFDMSGRKIAEIDRNYFTAGIYNISYPIQNLSANSLSNGSYILSVNSDKSSDFTIIKIAK